MFKPNLNLILAVSVALTSLAQAASRTPGAPTPLLTKRSEAELLSVLKSDAPLKDKADACRELGVVGTKEAIPVLAGMLADEKMNHIARYALEPNPDPAVDDTLREALGKLQGRPLVGVIGSLGVRRDVKAVAPLSAKLNDADADVAQAAARALGKIGTTAAAQAIQSALAGTAAGNQLAFCEGLFRCAESLAAKGARDEAIAIYDRLRNVKEPHQVRAGGWRGAIVTRGKDGLSLLTEALRSDDWIVVAAGARAALEMPGGDATPALVAELGKGSVDKQVLVAQVLAKRGDAAALPALSAAAKSGDKAVRMAALRALPQIGDASSAPVLVDLMGDADREIAQAAQDGVAALPGPAGDATVLAMLNAGDPARRVTALDLITRRRMTYALSAVAKATRDPDAQVRSAAVRRLGELSSPGDLSMLLGLLTKASSAQELEAAEQALSTVGTRGGDADATASQLTAALSLAKPEQKAALLRVLSAIGGKNALLAIRGAVQDPNAEVHGAAIRALGDWKTADAAPDLLALAKSANDPKDKLLCLRSYLGLARNTDFPADQRLAMCRDVVGLAQTQDEKRLLLSALGSIQTQPALALIAPFLDDDSTKNEAGAATVAIAERLLRARGAAGVGPRLVEPLRKVSQNTANADLAKRAQALLQQAEGKAPTR